MPDTLLCVVCRGILGDSLKEDTQYASEEDFLPDVHICVDCSRKDKLHKLVKRYTPFMREFSKLVNTCVFDNEGILTDALVTLFFSEHRYLQNEMIIGLLKILTKIGKESGNTMYEDPRNQWGLKMCKAISKLEV
jgi:hypothetical protein